MATPKKRLCRSKRDMRRAHDFLTVKATNSCSNCGAIVKPHHVCPSCGYYKGKSIVTAQQATAAQ